jgi:hypothetical protein
MERDVISLIRTSIVGARFGQVRQDCSVSTSLEKLEGSVGRPKLSVSWRFIRKLHLFIGRFKPKRSTYRDQGQRQHTRSGTQESQIEGRITVTNVQSHSGRRSRVFYSLCLAQRLYRSRGECRNSNERERSYMRSNQALGSDKRKNYFCLKALASSFPNSLFISRIFSIAFFRTCSGFTLPFVRM